VRVAPRQICEKFALEASPPALHSDCIPAEGASRVFKIGEFGRKAGEQFPSCH
jgi:hypothetical protein